MSTTTTDHAQAQVNDYESLTREERDRLWRLGDVRGIPIRCDYCDRTAAWATENGPSLRLACANAAHIAWSQSNGSACPVSMITPDSYPVDPTTVVPAPPCGCEVFAENDGRFTTKHEDPCPQSRDYYREPLVPVPAGLLRYLIVCAEFVKGGGHWDRYNFDDEGTQAVVTEARSLFEQHAAEWARRLAERDRLELFKPGECPF